MITLNFLITSLIVVLIPGTGGVYTISTGSLWEDARASLPRWAVPLGSSRI
jgi:hypothetical protein